MNEEVDPALVVERLRVENALLKSELRSVTLAFCAVFQQLVIASGLGQVCRLCCAGCCGVKQKATMLVQTCSSICRAG